MDKDHHFTGNQQAEYDSLHHNGRRAYDKYRWYDKDSHEDAYAQALELYGHNKPYLAKKEQEKQALLDQIAMLQMGIDPRITW
jgi:hypothetical protein